MIDHGITVENLVRVFPMAFAEDDRLQALGKTIAEELVRRSAEARLSVLYANIDSLPENVLDILAYDFKVDWWDTSYTPEEKRQTLKDSWKVHRMMGTKTAVEMAISAIYPNTTVEEWFEYGGDPYSFKLQIPARDLRTDDARHTAIMNRVNYYKNLRSHLDGIVWDYSGEPFVNKPSEFELTRFSQRFALSSLWYMPPVRFDGSIRFDAELQTVRFDGGARFDGASQFGIFPPVEGSYLFDQAYTLTHWTGFTVSTAMPPVQEHVGATLTIDNLYSFDGSVSFNGARRFDASITQEVI